MNAEQLFMMGLFEARFPDDRRYSKNHLWAQSNAEGRWRFGFTAYAVRLLQDVYFLEWNVDAGAALRERQAIGAIESSKAESELYAPIAGQAVQFNQDLLTDPSTINVDNYGRGWLFSLVTAGENLLSLDDYLVHLTAAWEVAQRTIKGQMNE